MDSISKSCTAEKNCYHENSVLMKMRQLNLNVTKTVTQNHKKEPLQCEIQINIDWHATFKRQKKLSLIWLGDMNNYSEGLPMAPLQLKAHQNFLLPKHTKASALENTTSPKFSSKILCQSPPYLVS